MYSRFARFAAGLLGGVIAGASTLVPATAGEMKPDEAKRFIANKVFSYTCFDGTIGAGRIQADGSVIGSMETSGRTRYFSLPAGTIRVSSDSICASLPRAP